LGGLPFLARACERPLEFVGNLISHGHHNLPGPARSDMSAMLLEPLWRAL
jgi:hypothetical protein